MSIWTTIKETSVNVCEKVDTTVGGALLKTERRLTGGHTLDEKAAQVAPVVCDAVCTAVRSTNNRVVQPACDGVVRASKKLSAVVVEKTSGVRAPSIKKVVHVVAGRIGSVVSRASEKARSLKKGAPAPKVTCIGRRVGGTPTPASIASTLMSMSQIEEGLFIDMDTRLALIAEQAGVR